MSAPRIVLPKRQAWLIERIQAAGYRSDPGGVCFGIAHMGMQAIFAEDRESFDQRLKVISDLRPDDFKLLFTDKKSFDQRLKIIADKQTHKISREDIIAFFDGVELYQNPHLYPHLFEKNNAPKVQDAILTSPLALSVALDKKKGKEEQGGFIKACGFSGIYNKAELVDYFAEFILTLENDPNITHPLAFVLRNAIHAITVAYNPAQKQWFFINANRLPTERITKADMLAKRISSAFLLKDVTAFSSEIHVPNEHHDAINNVINIWQTQESWKKMHTASPTKAQLLDSWEGSWLYIAAQMGYLEEVKALLRTDADLHQVLNSSKIPLHYAIKYNHTDVVKALLQDTRIDPNQAMEGVAPLLRAANQGNLDLVNALLQHPSTNPQKALTSNNDSPLAVAAEKGNLDAVNALLKDLRIDPNQANKAGATPLFYAALNGQLDVVIALLKDKRINPNHSLCDDNTTPILIATIIAHVDIVKVLLQDARTDPDKARTDTATPLFWAAQSGNVPLVELLIKHKADIIIPFTSSIENLRSFAKTNKVEPAMEALINEKIKQSASSTISLTSIEIAKVMGHSEVVNLLKTASPTHISAKFLRLFTPPSSRSLSFAKHDLNPHIKFSTIINKST